MRDLVKLPGYRLTRVGNGSGNINWRQSTLAVSGGTWLHSLKWLGALLGAQKPVSSVRPRYAGPYTAAQKRAFLRRTIVVTQDWIRDNRGWQRADPRGPARWPVASAAHRLQVLLCLRERTGAVSWLDQAVAEHVAFLVGNPRASDRQRYVYPTWRPPASWPRWQGANNVGLDQSLAVLGAGCRLGRRDWAAIAMRRIQTHAAIVYDYQGVDNEQAPGYSAYLYRLWTTALSRITQCGLAPVDLSARLAAAADFLTMAHRPDGNVENLGDSVPAPAAVPGTTAEYAGTQGRQGMHPTKRVGVYNSKARGGYVFGRSGWGDSRPFALESFYSLRFGPGRSVHGHNDHLSVTYWARGRQVLADAGHFGYTAGRYRNWLISPEAHNVPLVSGAAFSSKAFTTLTYAAPGSIGDSYTMVDKAYAGSVRQRSVLVVPDPDVLLVLDTVTSATSRLVLQLWHLPSEYQGRVALQRPNAVATSGTESVQVLPIALSGTAAKVSIASRWVSTSLNTRFAAPMVVTSSIGRTVRLLTVVAPTAAGTPVAAAATAEPGRTRVDVSIGGRVVTAYIDPAGHLIR